MGQAVEGVWGTGGVHLIGNGGFVSFRGDVNDVVGRPSGRAIGHSSLPPYPSLETNRNDPQRGCCVSHGSQTSALVFQHFTSKILVFAAWKAQHYTNTAVSAVGIAPYPPLPHIYTVSMPIIRNPFRKQDENVRPTAAVEENGEKKSGSLNEGNARDPVEYKLSGEDGPCSTVTAEI